MDIRDEIGVSKPDSLAKADLLSKSDQNKLPNVDYGVSKATAGGLPRFNPYDEVAEKKARKAAKAAKNVLNPTPLSMYDPTKSVVSAKAAVDVQEKEKVVKDKKEEKVVKDKKEEKVVKAPSIVKEKEEKVVKDKKEKEKLVKGKENEKDKVVKDKKEKDKVGKGKETEKEKVVTDKELQVREVIANVVSDLAIEKPKEKSKEKVKSKASKEPQDQHASKSSKSSKSVKKNTFKFLSEAPILRIKQVEQDDTPNRKRVVSKADKSKKDTVDIQDSQLNVKKKKAKLQEQEDTVDIQDTQLNVKKKKVKVQEEDSDDFQDEKKQKLKTKVVVKRKRDDLGSDSSDSEQVVVKRKNVLKKKVVKDESDEDVKVKPKKRGQKKEKELTPEEAKHKEYVSSFQILHARTVPTSLYNAIRQSKQVNMGKFFSEIGFSSFNNLDIDYIPSKLGRYVVSKFDAQTYMLTLENGKSIEVTHAKIHEILGIPTGGISLFSLDYRPDSEFERRWVGQFGSMSLKEIRVKDITLKLIKSKEVDFLFKVNFLTLFINTMGKCAGLKGKINMEVVRRLREDTDISGIDWCDYIYNCLQYSKVPSTFLNQYTGPYLFLVLLYLDSTKFERLPIVRTRPV